MKKSIIWLAIGTLALTLTAVIWSLGYTEKSVVPVYSPADLNPELVDIGFRDIRKGHTVADFRLVNQNGDTITQINYREKIYVVDFFFTRCPSICPVMSRSMRKLQEHFKNNEKVLLLSISVTPEYDSVPVLREYAFKNGARATKWNITTGDKKHIYGLARKSYFAVTDQGDGGLQDFIHTPNFILVDTEKQIRGIYDGTDDLEIKRLIRDINIIEQ